jgi:catechol 2,3-dioxygenase-like lactoylglutathione lyase family enzyme
MAAHDDPPRKFHASLNVRELDRAVAFYRVLLGAEPAKRRPDYAKFELSDPPLVLSLIPGGTGAGGSLNHVGLRVRDAEELVEVQRRLEAAGHTTTREDGVACCYSRQTKFWVSDPDRVLWEIYIFHEDIEERGSADPPRIAPLTVGIGAPLVSRIWEHRLPDPIPERVPHDDNSLHDIHLEGSINLAPGGERLERFLVECLRALRPGAALHLHGLSGDRASQSQPSLPGPAAAVQHVPATGNIVDALVRTGFVDVEIELLSETAYFVVDGVSMREVRTVARKPGHRPQIATHQAVYLGPMERVIDDFGNVFTRGVPTPLNVHDWQVLSKSAARSAFLFLKPETSTIDASRADRPPTPSTRASRSRLES